MNKSFSGDKKSFAIESEITEAFERPGLRALGFFVVYIGNYRYGVHAPRATMLACSFDEVKRRMANRGKHMAPFANESDASRIAIAVDKAIYASRDEGEIIFDTSLLELRKRIGVHKLLWAPDGDAAFDD